MNKQLQNNKKRMANGKVNTLRVCMNRRVNPPYYCQGSYDRFASNRMFLHLTLICFASFFFVYARSIRDVHQVFSFQLWYKNRQNLNERRDCILHYIKSIFTC